MGESKEIRVRRDGSIYGDRTRFIEAVRLRDGGVPVKELAAAYKVSEGRVRSIIARGRRMLKIPKGLGSASTLPRM